MSLLMLAAMGPTSQQWPCGVGPYTCVEEQDDLCSEVEFSAKFGVLDIAAEVAEVDTSGRNTRSLKIVSSSLVHLNRQLDFLVYINTEPELGRLDLVNFRYLDHDVTIPIRINFRPVPLLYDPGSDDNIDRKVTVVTKTFLRYFSVRNLIRSIRKFYPTIRIVIADDSRPVEDLQGDNVDHYVMPFGVGWFAGWNLAVSQVKTPYMLWVDDDFLFIPETKLEKFVDVLDNADIDIVSGLVGRDRLSLKKLNILEGDEEGDCLVQTIGTYGTLKDFPECHRVDRVTNFFLGRTDKVREVGFDPAYSRFAHTAVRRRYAFESTPLSVSDQHASPVMCSVHQAFQHVLRTGVWIVEFGKKGMIRPVESVPGKGWFAGRNLAVSQVKTPYMLWVDDDFLFIPETKLEKFVDVLDNADIDIVSGLVGRDRISLKKLNILEGDEEGDCLIQTIGTYGTLKDFPECHRVDRVTNFFLGRTDKVREVGFDPAYSRFAHTEFFYEGLGKLRSAACSFAKIGHNQKSNDQYTKMTGQKGLFSKAAAAAVGMVTVKAAPMGAKACTYTSPDDTSIDKGYKVYLGNCAACH
ncbi:B4GALNT2 [Branchiostoma lanceolatum]|uniref:B4GALNT2 protein n=1 Tax=Branchiostoma lanceolatum TaxID=7740 RepID=A0A8K0AAI1_BRALA|nr:B4GALNT2 [Branchiostoma lanceolatum]